MAIQLTNTWMELIETIKQAYLNDAPTRFTSIALFKLPLPVPLDCRTILYADFTICNFDGYADQPCHTWGSPANVGGCRWRILHPFIQWTPTGITTPNDVYGYLIYEELSGAVWWFELFSGGPITVGDTLIPFLVFPRLDELSI